MVVKYIAYAMHDLFSFHTTLGKDCVVSVIAAPGVKFIEQNSLKLFSGSRNLETGKTRLDRLVVV
jgi:hypothetical protein